MSTLSKIKSHFLLILFCLMNCYCYVVQYLLKPSILTLFVSLLHYSHLTRAKGDEITVRKQLGLVLTVV